MTTIASQINSLAVLYSTVYSDADKKNIKAPRHWPLCGEFTGTMIVSLQYSLTTNAFEFHTAVR